MRVREYMGIPYFVDDGPPRRVWCIDDVDLEVVMEMPGKHILKLDLPSWKDAVTEYLNKRMLGTVTVDQFDGLEADLSECEIHFQMKDIDKAKDTATPRK